MSGWSRFSNAILQTLQVCIKRIPRIIDRFVLSTTSRRQLLDELDIADCFNCRSSCSQINFWIQFLLSLLGRNCSLNPIKLQLKLSYVKGDIDFCQEFNQFDFLGISRSRKWTKSFY